MSYWKYLNHVNLYFDKAETKVSHPHLATLLSISLYISAIVVAVLYFTGVEGFGCFIEDTTVGCIDMNMESLDDCEKLMIVSCSYESSYLQECNYEGEIDLITGYDTCIEFINVNYYYNGDYCMPLECCGVLKNVLTCHNVSTSIPLIISSVVGINTFLSVIYLAYSSLREVKIETEESDNDKANEAPNPKQEPKERKEEKDNGDSNEIRKSEGIEHTDDTELRQKSRHLKSVFETTTKAESDIEISPYKTTDPLKSSRSPSKVENTKKNKKSVKKERYDWEALI